jgi:hypothetical protein
MVSCMRAMPLGSMYATRTYFYDLKRLYMVIAGSKRSCMVIGGQL